MRLEFSPESQLDLIEIAAFIAHDNPARAKSFVDDLEADCGRLTIRPGSGAPRPELGDGVRVLPHGRYLIFTGQMRTLLGLRVSCTVLVTWEQRFTIDIAVPDGDSQLAGEPFHRILPFNDGLQ